MTAEVQKDLGALDTSASTGTSNGMEEDQAEAMTMQDPQQPQHATGTSSDGEGGVMDNAFSSNNKQPQEKLHVSSGADDQEKPLNTTGSTAASDGLTDGPTDVTTTSADPVEGDPNTAADASTASASNNLSNSNHNSNSNNRSGVSIISQSEDENDSEEMAENSINKTATITVPAHQGLASADNSPAIIPPDDHIDTDQIMEEDNDIDGDQVMNDVSCKSMNEEDIFPSSAAAGSGTSETAETTTTKPAATGPMMTLGELANQDSAASDAAKPMSLADLAHQDSESSVDFDSILNEAPVIMPRPMPNQIQPKQSFRHPPPIRSISEDESQRDLEISDRLLRVEVDTDKSTSSLPPERNNKNLASIRDGGDAEDDASVGGSSVAHSISSVPGTQQAVNRASQRHLGGMSSWTPSSGASLPGGLVKRSNSFKVNRMWKGIKKRLNVVSGMKKKSKSKSPSRRGGDSHRSHDSEGANSVSSVPIPPKATPMAAAPFKRSVTEEPTSRGRDRDHRPQTTTTSTQQPHSPYRRVHTSPGPRPRHSSPVRTRVSKFAASVSGNTAPPLGNKSTHSTQGRRGKGLPSRALNRSKSEGEFLATARNFNREQLQSNKNARSAEELKELEAIGRALKDGLTYCTMPDRLNKKITYNKCFSGSAAVDFLSIYTRKSREAATQVGRELADQFGLFVALGANKFPSTDGTLWGSSAGGASSSSYSFSLQDSRSAYYRMVAFLPNEVKRMNMMTKVRVFEEGVKVKTRRQGLRKHKKCFVGAEAVQFLVRSRMVKTRAEAVELGRKFVRQFNLFEPVLRDHEFEDSRNKLYRFVDKRNRYFSIDNMLSTRMIAMGREESDISGGDIDEDDEKDADGSHEGSSLMSNSQNSRDIGKFANSEDDEDAISAEYQRLTEVADILERGIKVSDHSKRAPSKKGVSYKDTFVAARAVTFMVTCGLADNRDEAAALGRRLEREFNLFTEATGKHDFSDSNYYFRFTDKKDRFSRPVKAELPLREVAARFEQGVKVKDHTYRLKSYKNTFMGSSAVDFLVNTNIATSRSQAVRLGCQLAGKYNLFEKVTGNREFSDDQVFFRFTPLNQRKVPEEETPQYKKKRRPGRAFLLDRSEESRATLVPKHVTEEMLAIAENFLNGVKIKEHKFRAKAYRGTFVGSEAVSFMVNSSLAKSRKDAVDLGRKLTAEVGLFLQIDGKKEFKDDYLLYRFSEKFERQLTGDAKTDTPLRGLMSDVSGMGTINLKSLPLEKIAEAFRNGMKIRNDDQSESSEMNRRNVAAELLDSSGQLFRRGSDHKSEKTSGRKNKKKKPGKKPEGAFVGTDAVDFLVGSGLAESRVEAVDLGRTLAREFNLFEHCDKEHEFEDEEFFYMFCYEGEIRPMDEIQMDISRLMVIAKDFEMCVKVKENKFRLRKYKKTFLGCDAVDYLVDSCTATSRKEAVQIGRAITKEFSLFEHVTNDRKFEDSNIPYFFVNDSQRYKGLNLEKKRARRYIFAQSDDDDSASSNTDLGACSVHSRSAHDQFNFSFNTEDTEWAKKMATFERKMHATATGPFPKMLAEGSDESSQSSSEVRIQRMENRFMEWASKFHRLDPRYQIRYFFDFVAQDGAENAETNVMDVDNLRPLYNFLPTRAQVFSVWRPTSADAIRKMMLGEAVGKGLDIKGKSAKRGKLSGFVPFLQIGENKHKSKIRTPSKEGVVRVFYPGDSRRGRDIAAEKLERVGLEMIETVEGAKEVLADNDASKAARKDALDAMLLDLGPDPSITYIDDYAPNRYGLEIPERLFWEAFFVRQDCTRKPGSEYDTGRPSQPAFQDMNFAAIRAEPKENAPRAVVYQGADVDSPMNPFELLVAYEEEGRVMPVVSDFDCFLVGTKRVKFTSPLAEDQLKVLKWYVGEIESVMKSSKVGDSWTVNWLEILKKAARDGFYPEMPRFGFGDPKSYSIMKNAVSRLSHSGAVRHGAECFNYYFPQDLDDEFLVIANDLPDGKPWAYVDVEGLQDILEEKIEQGFTFPLNPKWVLCDAFRWYDLYSKLLNSDKQETVQSMNCWFPPDSGLRELIERVHKSRPQGFYQGDKDGDADDDSSSEGGIGLGGGGADAKETMMSTVVAIRLLEKFQERTKKYQSFDGDKEGGSDSD